MSSRPAALLAAITVVVGLGSIDPGVDPRPSGLRPSPVECGLGVSPGARILDLGPKALETEMANIDEVGAGWVRIDIDWSRVEPAVGHFNWATTDRVVERAAAHGVRVLGLVAYTPEWARARGATSSHAPPEDVDKFAKFAAIAADRYRGVIDTWEVWNEPNLGWFWEPTPNPLRYAELLQASAMAIHSVDPDLIVLHGGLAPAVSDDDEIEPAAFLDRVLATGAGATIDALAIHPYTYPALPTDPGTGHWNTFTRLPEIYELGRKYGHDLDLWLTEFGAPTGTSERAVSAKRQARTFADAFAQIDRWPWVAAVFVYSMTDAGNDPANPEHNFGIRNGLDMPKPAWDVVSAYATESCS